MNASHLLEELRGQQVTITVADDQLNLDGPAAVLTDELLTTIA